MYCEVTEELAIAYMVAVDSVAAAREELGRAFTQMQVECASTKLARVEAHRLSVFRELKAHCEQHGCAGAEIDRLLFSQSASNREPAAA